MSNLNKLLSKFNEKERRALELSIKKVISLQWRGLDVKKLKGYQNIFRLRKKNLRITFQTKNKSIFILAIERWSEKTYKI